MVIEEEEKCIKRTLDPLESSINTIEAYFVKKNEGNLSREEIERDFTESGMKGATVHAEGTYVILPRTYTLRKQIASLLTMKKYPFIRSYRFHHQLFVGLWLVCLPLSVTAEQGFLSIITCSIIYLGVLALETSISDLRDPFSQSRTLNLEKKHNVPVDEMCDDAVSDILSAVKGTDWDIDGSVYSTSKCPTPYIGNKISDDGTSITSKYDLPSLQKRKRVSEEGRKDALGKSTSSHHAFLLFSTQATSKHEKLREGNDELKVRYEYDIIRKDVRKSMSAKVSYFLYSIPWGLVQAATVWTVFACLFSFLTRDQLKDHARWWISPLSLAANESAALSFITFNLLAFYVNASYNRYCNAAKIWEGELQWLLHSLMAEFRINWPSGAIHDRDQERLAGHIAALPYALRSDLRNSRDVREVLGLLSKEDYAKMVCAESMSVHVVSTIRAYYTKAAIRSETISSVNTVKQGRLNLMFRIDIPILESTIHKALHYRNIDIAPHFTVLLNVWLTIWFFFLPFILVEFAGWIAIFWVPLIAISILGLRQLAREIVQPYGNDWNDLDLDQVAHNLSADVISAYRTARIPSETPHLNLNGSYPKEDGNFDHSLIAKTSATSSSELSKARSTASSFSSFDSQSTSLTHSTVEGGKSIYSTGKRNRTSLHESIDPLDPTVQDEIEQKFLCSQTKRFSSATARRTIGTEQLKIAMQAMSRYDLLFVLSWSLFALTFSFLISLLFPVKSIGACEPWYCSFAASDTTTMEYIGYGLFLLLSFRMADSHQRYADAVRIWNEDVVGTSYLLLNRFYLCFKPDFFHHKDMERVSAHIEAFAINLMSDLRQCGSQRGYLLQLDNLLDDDIEHMLRAERCTDTTIDVIRGYLVEAERLPVEKRVFSGNDLTRIFIHLRRLIRSAPSCNSIKNVQIPNGYLIHLRFFILLWIMVLPFGIVEQTGWTSMFWCLIISYAVVGIEHWASELSDPFGCDSSDVPLERHLADVIKMVMFHNSWAGTLVKMANIGKGRPAFRLDFRSQCSSYESMYDLSSLDEIA